MGWDQDVMQLSRTVGGQDRTAQGQESPAAGCQEKLSGLQVGSRAPSCVSWRGAPGVF